VRGLDVLSLTASEYLSENEIAAAALADQGRLFNPQQQFRVSWPAEPVVARAYLDQLQRDGGLSESLHTQVAESLDESATALADGGRDRSLARQLASLAKAAEKEQGGDATASKRRADLAQTLNGIAERLRG